MYIEKNTAHSARVAHTTPNFTEQALQDLRTAPFDATAEAATALPARQ